MKTLLSDGDLITRVGSRRASLPVEYLTYTFSALANDGSVHTDSVHARSYREAKETATEYAVRILRLPARGLKVIVNEPDLDDEFIPFLPV